MIGKPAKFKIILYKPNAGAGWIAKRKFDDKAYGLGLLADAVKGWAGKLAEVKDDFVMNTDGDWLMLVEMNNA